MRDVDARLWYRGAFNPERKTDSVGWRGAGGTERKRGETY